MFVAWKASKARRRCGRAFCRNDLVVVPERVEQALFRAALSRERLLELLDLAHLLHASIGAALKIAVQRLGSATRARDVVVALGPSQSGIEILASTNRTGERNSPPKHMGSSSAIRGLTNR